MTQRLLIHLADAPDFSLTWGLWDSSAGQLLRDGQLDPGQGSGAELADLSRRLPAYLLVPGTAIVQRCARLPSRSREARKGIPYLLEEQLCADPAELHFASGPVAADGTCLTAVVSRQRLEHWLQQMAENGIRLKGVFSSTDALPRNAERAEGMVVNRELLLRYPDGRGLGLDVELLHADLRFIALPEHPLTLRRDASHLTPLPGLAPDQTEQMLDEPALHALFRHFDPAQGINLLQGEYQAHDQLRELARPWRWPAITLLLLAAVHLGGLLIDQVQLRKQEAALQARITETFRQAMPDTRRIINPRRQLENRLLEAERLTQGSPLFLLLDPLSEAMVKTPQASLEALRFAENQASLELKVSSYSELEQLTTALEANGLSVQRGAFRQQGTVILGQLSISGGAQ